MRYYGKQGSQCAPRCDHAQNLGHRAHLVARSVLFGRVPQVAVRGLGILALLGVLVLAGWLMIAPPTAYHDIHRPMGGSLLIKR